MKRMFTFTRATNFLVAVVLAGVPFYALLTVWGSALVGHYTLLRLWPDILLTILCIVLAIYLCYHADLRAWLAGSLLVRLIAMYAGLTLLLGFVSWAKGDVAPKALAYGVLVNLRFLAWFLVVLFTARQSTWLRRVWPRLLLIPAAVVVAFAVLQYTALPHNFLAHFGYSTATNIAPIETINHNSHYIRVQSTLRGANPLGAYLVMVLSTLGVLFWRGQRKVLCVVFGAASLFALYASGSRSAWLGTLLALAIAFWLLLRARRARLIFTAVVAAILLLAGGSYAVLRHSAAVQNAVLHTQDNSAAPQSSNSGHLSALRSGLQDVMHQPFGDGPGTAGPASVYNAGHPGRISENYFLQIAQETGWLGLALLLSILVLIGIELHQRAARSRLALALFASLIGLSFVSLLSHAWTDATLAYLWWGLAGVALALPPTSKDRPL